MRRYAAAHRPAAGDQLGVWNPDSLDDLIPSLFEEGGRIGAALSSLHVRKLETDERDFLVDQPLTQVASEGIIVVRACSRRVDELALGRLGVGHRPDRRHRDIWPHAYLNRLFVHFPSPVPRYQS